MGWWNFRKVALVNFVECLEALRAYTDHVDLHDVLEVGSRRLKCRLQLFQSLRGIFVFVVREAAIAVDQRDLGAETAEGLCKFESDT